MRREAPDDRLHQVLIERAPRFARVPQSLTITGEDGKSIKRTPAMAAGVTDHVWTLREIAGLLD